MRLAVLGMGRMGPALVERLLGGDHEVTVWNMTSHKANDLVVKGAREAGTPALLAAREGVLSDPERKGGRGRTGR